MNPFATRREFLKWLAAGSAIAGARPAWAASAPTPTSLERRPNFLVVLVDDVGRECLSCFGGESFSTPNIDRLAATGVAFNTCYATPMCCPSRVEILTGRYSFRNYVAWDYIDPRDATFGSVLRDAGYATALAGKWHFDGWRLERPAIETAGFQNYVSYDYEGVRTEFSRRQQGNQYWNLNVFENGAKKRIEGHYVQDYYADFLDAFIRQNRDRPFLAHCCLDLLHRPFARAAEVDPRWPGGTVAASELGAKGDAKNFPGMVAAMDRIVGRLMRSLQDAGVLENTIVVFAADNGTDNIAEATDLRMRYRGRSVRGGKYRVDESGINVPLIVSCPGRFKSGVRTDELVDFSDILPTLADLAGARSRLPTNLDGHSFRSVLEGRSGERNWIYSWGVLVEPHTSRTYQSPITFKDEHLHVLRDKRWKYFSNGALYDLDADPFEETPLAKGASTAADEARRTLAAQLADLRRSKPALW